MLVFPFSWRAAVLESVVLVLTIWLVRKYVPSKILGFAASRWWIVVAVMFIFAAACPFIVLPKPLYIANLESDNPGASRTSMLNAGARTIGSVMMLSGSDCIRNWAAPLLEKYWPATFRCLEDSHYGERTYCLLPTLNDFIVDTRTPDDTIWKRSIYFPLNVQGRFITLKLAKQEPLNPEIAPQRNTVLFGYSAKGPLGLLNFAYTQYPDAIPWNAVQIRNGNDYAALKYTALLDCAFHYFATGHTGNALSAMEAAIVVRPHSDLEAARLAALQYVAVRSLLGGNIGRVQSLPYLHKAYELFLAAQSDPRFSQRDPLTSWLRATLLTGYQEWEWSLLFFNRVSKLKSIPHLKKEDSYFESFGDSLKQKSKAELLNILKHRHLSAAELHYIDYTIYGTSVETFLTQFEAAIVDPERDILEDNDDRIPKVAFALTNADAAIPIMQRINVLLSRRGDVSVDPNQIKFLHYLRNSMALIFTANSSEIGDVLKRQLDQTERPDAKAIYMLYRVINNKVSEGELLKMKDSEWWTPEYFIWFEHWFEDAVVEIQQHNYPEDNHYPPINHDMSDLMLKCGANCLTKDMNGHGRTFYPGLFCLAWYEETFGNHGQNGLKEQFRNETMIPLSTYISSLYTPLDQAGRTNGLAF